MPLMAYHDVQGKRYVSVDDVIIYLFHVEEELRAVDVREKVVFDVLHDIIEKFENARDVGKRILA